MDSNEDVQNPAVRESGQTIAVTQGTLSQTSETYASEISAATQTAINALTSANQALLKVNDTEKEISHQKDDVEAQRRRVDELAQEVDKSKRLVNNIVGAVGIALLAVLISAVFFEIQFIQSSNAARDQMQQFIVQEKKTK